LHSVKQALLLLLLWLWNDLEAQNWSVDAVGVGSKRLAMQSSSPRCICIALHSVETALHFIALLLLLEISFNLGMDSLLSWTPTATFFYG
jgi:hypothetical protein